jgi:DNA-binding IclR family transcriptional regulator
MPPPSAKRSSAAEGGTGVQVIARAAQVLRALDGEPSGLSLSQLTKRVGLPRSTVHRIVMALGTEGLVAAASPNGRVRLGPELARLAEASRRDRWQDLRPHMQRLFDTLDETVDCAVLEGDQLRFVDQISGAHGLRAVSAVGAVFPLHCTANGKALLAALEPEEVIALLPERLEPLTPNTITRREQLIEELIEVRATGVAFDREEHLLGVSAGGIALRDSQGALAALSVPMPTPRFAGREREIMKVLQRVRRDAMAAFGRL